jgi:hypothetical protein
MFREILHSAPSLASGSTFKQFRTQISAGPLLKFNFVADPSLNPILGIKISLHKYLKRSFRQSSSATEAYDQYPSLLRFRPNKVCDIAKIWL